MLISDMLRADSKPREHWGSRFGFVVSSVGSAVGLGNVWRFPTLMARSGGGAFLAIYLVAAILIGVPLMIAELAIGRRAQRNVVGAFSYIEPGRPSWRSVGLVSVAASMVVLSFYSVIAGWIGLYIVGSASGGLVSSSSAVLSARFASISGSPFASLAGQATFLTLTAIIVTGGISKGIERANRVLMPGIVAILVILMGRTLFLPGAGEGVAWFVRPNLAMITPSTVLNAVGQVFFSFSLGMGAVLTYGSYLSSHDDIVSSSFIIGFSDLGISLLAGLIVIPALFAFGVPLDTGPGLVFVALPAVLSTLPFSVVWSTLFFAMLLFAALSSSVSVLETTVAYLVDERRWSRRRATVTSAGVVFVLGVPSALSGGVLAGQRILGRNALDFADFVSSNILLLLAGFLTVAFVGWVWGADNVVSELGGTDGFRWSRLWTFLVKFVIPLGIAAIFVAGLR